jgi:uncharacterized Ntn-hydrolase superfamily protein
MTYSIVARDPASGDLGVAVQTAFFGVGSICPWARAGVGAVATQAFAEPAYGPRILGFLDAGDDATTALDRAIALDESAPMRQVGVVDAAGRVAGFTGDLCVASAGHHHGDGFTAQANMCAGDVWTAMAETYAGSTGPLAQRLFAALRAADEAGGDARGRISAAMKVVDGTRRDNNWEGVILDVRVEHHPAPLDELGRLIDAATAYASFDRSYDAALAGDGATALAEVDGALGTLPDDVNLRFARVSALAAAGRIDEAGVGLRALVAERPTLRPMLVSFQEKGLLPLPSGVELADVLDEK